MDSFDMMGQFDSMLPPGDIFRKTFDSALMGLESKGGGGGQKSGGSDGPDWDEVADLQHEQAMNSYEYDWDNTQRQYNHMLLQNEIQRRDQFAQNQYQTGQQKQQWMYANAMKEQEYNAQMGAYNKSEKMYSWQVEMNEISAAMAHEAQSAQTAERYQELVFAGQAAAIQHGAKKLDLTMQGLGADLDISSKRITGQQKKQELTIDQQTKRGVAAAQSVEDLVKGMQAMGQVEAKGQAGGSAAKQYQAIAAQSSRLQAAKAYQLNRSDIATRLALYGVDKTLAQQEAGARLTNAQIGQAGLYADMENALGIEQREATRLSIGSAHHRADKKIAHDQYVANVQADFNRMSAPSMGIPIPKPLEIPMATIIDPIIPVKGKKPVWGAGMGAGPSSGGSTGGGGAASGLMAGAGGLAMSMPGAFAAGSALGPIGLGVTAVGMIGGAFGLF